MPNQTIPDLKIRQFFLILIITALVVLMVYNLKLFIPSVLGAVTLYIITRKYNFYKK